MNTKTFGIACLMLAGLSGCALTTDHVALQYDKQQNVEAIDGAENIAVNVQVNDLRQDKTRVSSKKNGFGMEMAPILATEDVTITLRRAIEQELESRGFQLDEDAKVYIKADLTRFYNDHKVGAFSGDAVADLNMMVAVKSKNGKRKYLHQIVAQGLESNTVIMGGENARLALNKALANGMKMLFEDKKFLSALHP